MLKMAAKQQKIANFRLKSLNFGLFWVKIRLFKLVSSNIRPSQARAIGLRAICATNGPAVRSTGVLLEKCSMKWAAATQSWFCKGEIFLFLIFDWGHIRFLY